MKNGEDEVEDPGDRRSDEKPDQTCDQRDDMLFAYTFHDAVDRPENVQEGKGEKDFDDVRKIVHKLTVTHNFSPLRQGVSPFALSEIIISYRSDYVNRIA